ncbi:oxygen-insensitive NADPH nitroreductase [Bacillus canaveralius]|uniref:Oxygen-insensitive NADPH nitroreductase n=1 Tax=Bacillus canaveralius TaxID=1403243 RepID=A0A2N5GFY6_9BACI|nr:MULTISPECIES: oxygen-insensitive NADPH nitroreductase [Bacillus]PLR79666.1 oxygen-insensitive NADPH nitroreductase [Bacillus canaveralius]PLR80844.1 oxygen-insensitive NADPH nitroreductase [Bacillus sp. V33-4]PLS00858.1 oxygen-insensitive NADPH nitroreductase [Bacillus canaveralius]RSK53793.1 oxygen-insensitive NADPH nitroreductase [Bacillus canaveralius]
MNPTIETILNHRSIRSFEDKPLTDEQIDTIIACAQAAATSSFIQAYSIIGITDRDKKQKLSELAGKQSYVVQNGHFLVFCADLYRHQLIGEIEGKDVIPAIESTEKFMVALIDASLAAQNVAIAAESMGLGICYIGGIRNNLEEVSKLLKTPERVIPLFGLAIGVPMQEPGQKPRLPRSQVYHLNEYQQDKNRYLEGLEEYNETISAYYEQRTGGRRNDTWTGQIAGMLENQSRMYMKEYVQKSKLDLR